MGKGGKHKKFLRSEKAKTKLKGVKKLLPKGTNVTKTDFKVRQIVVQEQLKTYAANELLSRRKLNIKDLTARLQHHNVKARTEAIKDIKEVLSAHPAQVLGHDFQELFQSVLRLAVEKEKSVRRDALSLIALMLSHLSVTKITPFFDMLSSYLRCCMTHIDRGVQEDSILLLDAALKHFPVLVARDAEKLLPSFLDLVSKLRMDSQPGRMLTLNLGAKITSVKWRTKVLERLQALFQAVVNDACGNQSERALLKRREIPANNIYNLSIYDTWPHENSETGKSAVNDGASALFQHLDALVPILFETWLEVCPKNSQDREANVSQLTEESCSILESTVKIFLLIFKMLQMKNDESLKEEFISKYAANFDNHIFDVFPYTNTGFGRKRHQDSNTNVNSDISCLFVYFHESLRSGIDLENASKVAKFIAKSWQVLTGDQSCLCMLRKLLKSDAKRWDLDSLLMCTIKMHSFCKNQKSKEQLFDLLCELASERKFSENETFQTWISSLGKVLCHAEAGKKSVEMLLSMARQQNQLFIKSVEENFDEILGNLNGIKVKDSSGIEVGNELVTDLLLWTCKSQDHQTRILTAQNALNVVPA